MSDEEVIDLYALKVAELKKELSSRGLAVSGTKPILIERLEKYMQEHEGVEVVDEDDYEAEQKLAEKSVDEAVVVEAPVIGEEKDEDTLVGADSPPPQNSISMTEEDEDTVMINTTNDVKTNVTHSEIKTMSETERKSARGNRFADSTMTSAELNKKKTRAERFGQSNPASNSVSSSTPIESDKLKARRERFGAPVDSSESDVKKSRAERFGTTATLSSTSSAKSILLATGGNDKRAARAKRFGITH